jgi:hypothetical protein
MSNEKNSKIVAEKGNKMSLSPVLKLEKPTFELIKFVDPIIRNPTMGKMIMFFII